LAQKLLYLKQLCSTMGEGNMQNIKLHSSKSIQSPNGLINPKPIWWLANSNFSLPHRGMFACTNPRTIPLCSRKAAIHRCLSNPQTKMQMIN
jgi:hypothetical protein